MGWSEQAKVFMTHIPYRGTGPAVTDLLGGQIDVMFLPIHVALAHVKAGSLTALAISSDKPHPLLPDVPPLRALNLGRLDVEMWYACLRQGHAEGCRWPLEPGARGNSSSLPDVKAAFETQGMTPGTAVRRSFPELLVQAANDILRRALGRKHAVPLSTSSLPRFSARSGGTSGSNGMRLVAADGERGGLLCLHVGKCDGGSAGHDVDLATEQIGDGRTGAR